MSKQNLIYKNRSNYKLYSTISYEENCTESEKHSGLKWPWQVSSQPSVQNRQAVRGFSQSSLKNIHGWRVHNLSWQTFQYLIVLCWKSSLLKPVRNLLSSVYDFCLLSSHRAALFGAWLHLLKNVLAGTSRQLSGPCEVTCSPRGTSPIPLASVHMASGPAPWLSWWPFTDLIPVYQCHHPAGVWRTPLDVALQMQSNDCWVEVNNCIP